MSKVYETLKKKNDTSVEVYPNIERQNIPNGAVNSAKIEDGSITTQKLNDGSTTTSKIADNSITSAKIYDGAVTSAKINDGAVTTAKISDGAVTSAKLSFHLYEHNIIVANDNVNVDEAEEILIFKVLTNNGAPFTDVSDIASLLHERGFDLNKPLIATGRYSDDSFEVVTGIDWGQQSETTDYCETIIIGVYGNYDNELKAVVCTLSENETTKIYDIEMSSQYLYDNVVTLF